MVHFFNCFLFVVLDLVHTVQSETGGVKVEGHTVDPDPVPTPDHLHIHIAGPIPVPDLAPFLHVDPILDHLEFVPTPLPEKNHN